MHGLAGAAERIADLGRQATSAEACAEALSILNDAVGGDASTLQVVTRNTHQSIASVGYPDDLTRALRDDFVQTEWFDMVVNASSPPTISTELSQSFRRGWFYEENIAPAGFRDGLSCALRTDGLYTAVVHVSSRAQGALGAVPQAFIAGVAPTLLTFARTAAWLPPADIAPGLAALARTAANAGIPALRGIWATPAGWIRFEMGQHAPGSPVYVRANPFVVPYELTSREIQVLTHVALGMGNREIADHLVVSERTIHSHVQHLLSKTGLRSRTELAVLAVADNLLMPTEYLSTSHTANLKRALGSLT
ncbi:response regulator transcription factor [Aeromicrobium sp. CF3.5]|uniref:helix-turn-helix transcriptional regulator n=1 Tax=Aeromicrobium sp. CF3.5 TaxID=3373078 RepID=UPI003EE7A0DA